MDSYLATLSPATRRAYASDFRAYERWHGSPFTLTDGPTFYQIAREWQRAMEGEGLLPSTVKRRLAAIRGYAMHAHHAGMIDWLPSVPSVKQQPPQDTAGPGVDALRKMIRGASPRDALCYALLGIIGLRLSEARMLDMSDVDRSKRTLSVLRKGRGNARTVLHYPPAMDDLFTRWLGVRGIASGPLITRFDSERRPTLKRLGAKGFYNAVSKHGTHPHALRHTAATEAAYAIGEAGLPVQALPKFLGHASLKQSMVYFDNISNEQPEVARLVAQRVMGMSPPRAGYTAQQT